LSGQEIVCADLDAAIDDWKAKGFRLDAIYPADDPHFARLSRDGEQVRLTSQPEAPAPQEDPAPFVPEFLLTRGGEAGKGRAGMLYRDLIPGRLGGRYIASHISIPDGGPVADWVHYHRVAFQMIFVARGWVRVVYEDQGEPFVMNPGDLVLQPPQIRHRVLESSAGLEVIEISAPALHETLADYELELPNARVDPDRLFDGQRFLRHVSSESPWTPIESIGKRQSTAMDDATRGVADVSVLELEPGAVATFPQHSGELVFGFVLGGFAQLNFREGFELRPADAFVIPPKERWGLGDASEDFRLLQVTSGRLG
jgi:quercetin dioxygenase-like cupin family protein